VQIDSTKRWSTANVPLMPVSELSLRPVDSAGVGLLQCEGSAGKNQMRIFRIVAAIILGVAAASSVHASSRSLGKPSVPTIVDAVLLQKNGQAQLQITASEPIVPQSLLLANPERVVLDFVNAQPGGKLHDLGAQQQVRGVRTSLLSRNPPTTRIVLDLLSPRHCQLRSTENQIFLSVGAASEQTDLLPLVADVVDKSPASILQMAAQRQVIPATPPIASSRKVTYQNGFLWITAQRAKLSEVLSDIQNATRVKIELPAGAGQEKITVALGPAPLRQVIADLLERSSLDFTIVGSVQDPQKIDGIVLSTRQANATAPPKEFSAPAETAEAPSVSGPTAPDSNPDGPDEVPQPLFANQFGITVPIGPDTQVPASKDIPVIEADDDGVVSKSPKESADAGDQDSAQSPQQ
jgi:hypothetical protein